MTRQAPAAAGTRSATIASKVAIARDRRSSSSSPSARAASGMRSPSRTIGRRRRVVIGGPIRGSRRRAGRGRAPRRSGGPPPAPPRPWRWRTQLRVEVVERRRRHERLRQVGDPPDEMRAAVRVELGEDVVEQQERRPPVERGQEVELGQLEGQDRGPLLAARGEAREVASVELEDEVVAVRPDERRAVPDLLVGGLGEAARQRVARRLAGEWRRVRRVAQRQPAPAAPRPGRSRRGPPRAARPASSSRRSRSATIGPRRRGTPVPEAQLVAERLLLADRPEQAVALLERPPVGRQGVGVGRRAAAAQLVDGRPPERRRAR